MNKFKKLVRDCGLSTEGVSRLLGGNYHTVRNWLAGTRTPCPKAIKKLTAYEKQAKRIFRDE